MDLDDCYTRYPQRSTVTRELTQNQNSDLVNIAALLDDFDLESINLTDTNITLNNVDVNYVVANSIAVADIASDVDFNNFIMTNMTIEASDIGLTTPGDAVFNDLTVTGPMYGPDGTVVLPTYSFTSAPNSGIYLTGTGDVSIATNGQPRLVCEPGGTTRVFSLGGTSPILRISDPTYCYAPLTVTPVGSAAAPALQLGSINGLYRPASDELALSANGTQVLLCDSLGAVRVNTLGAIGSSITVPDRARFTTTGSAIDPTIELITGMGIYRENTSDFVISNAGAGRLRIDGLGDTFISGRLSVGETVYTSNGTSASPAYSFSSDTTTGMYRSGTNELSFATNGQQCLVCTAAGEVRVDTLGAVGSSIFILDHVDIDADLSVTGDISYGGSLIFTSDARVKTDIIDADPRSCYELVREMRLHEFTKSGTRCLGVIAQELEKLDPRLVRHSGRSFIDARGAYQDDMLSVDLDRLVSVLLGGLKHVISRLDEL
jgi:hypothetical protein